jgi:hypothetical protein
VGGVAEEVERLPSKVLKSNHSTASTQKKNPESFLGHFCHSQLLGIHRVHLDEHPRVEKMSWFHQSWNSWGEVTLPSRVLSCSELSSDGNEQSSKAVWLCNLSFPFPT